MTNLRAEGLQVFRELLSGVLPDGASTSAKRVAEAALADEG